MRRLVALFLVALSILAFTVPAAQAIDHRPLPQATKWVDWTKWYTVRLRVGFSSDPNIQAHTYSAWGVRAGQVGGIPQGTVIAPGITYSNAFLIGADRIYVVSELNSDHLIFAAPVVVEVIRSDGKISCQFFEDAQIFMRSRVDGVCLDN